MSSQKEKSNELCRKFEVRLKSPNPLFEKWLEEWYLEAAAKGSQFQHNLRKALISLRKFPLPLNSGRQCYILKSFGHKLCLMLDKKLLDYRKNILNSGLNNELIPPEIVFKLKNHSSIRPKELVPKVIDPINVTGTSESVCHDVNTSISVTGSTNYFSASSSRKTKSYVPAKGSGAYAIIIALHDHFCRSDLKGGMTKLELLKEAQQFCNVPFNQRTPGSYFCAWSAMSRLWKKQLVVKSGKPTRYALSKKGVELAERIKTIYGEKNSILKPSPVKLYENIPCDNNDDDDDDLDDDDDDVNNVSMTLTNVCDSTFKPTEYVNFNTNVNDTKKMKLQRVGNKATSKFLDDYKVHTFSESDEDDFFDERENHNFLTDDPVNHFGKTDFRLNTFEDKMKNVRRKPSCTVVRPTLDRDMDNFPDEISYPKISDKRFDAWLKSNKVMNCKKKSDKEVKLGFSDNQQNNLLSSHGAIDSVTSLSIANFVDENLKQLEISSVNDDNNIFMNNSKPSSSISTQNTPQSSQSTVATQENIRMFPYEYQLLLLIDTAETMGKGGNKFIENKFKQMHVNCEVSHLNVGDYAWICRDINGRELILPYIVERKRMDDLSKSIKDGRFHEQKFRLKSSPVKQRIYVVEGFGTGHTGGLPLQSLMQAATNTQIIDGFIVKFTKDFNHTLLYLASLTRKFIGLLEGKHLVVNYSNILPHFSWRDNILYLMTFENFMKNASKKKKFTVKEMFLRHLILLNGVSVEKAKAIVDIYPCPRLLIEKGLYLNGEGDERFLSKIKVGKLQRSLGASISKSIYCLYSKKYFD